MSKKISVIVPVFNTEKYLKTCLDSILMQTYKNLEIIIINDGSTDSSLNICLEYKDKDNRIIVLNKENGGQSTARNLGLSIATGEFIGFVDSDDWIASNMYEILIRNIENTSAEIAICDKFFDVEFNYLNQIESIKVLEKHDFMPLVLTDEISSHLWNKLFSKHVFYNINFTPNNTVEDLSIMHYLFDRVDVIVITSMKLYYYFINNQNSVSNNSKGITIGSYYRFLGFLDRYYFASQKYPQLNETLLTKAIKFALGTYGRMLLVDKEYIIEKNTIENFIKDNIKLIFSSREITLRYKIGAMLAIKSPRLYMLFILFKYKIFK